MSAKRKVNGGSALAILCAWICAQFASRKAEAQKEVDVVKRAKALSQCGIVYTEVVPFAAESEVFLWKILAAIATGHNRGAPLTVAELKDPKTVLDKWYEPENRPIVEATLATHGIVLRSRYAKGSPGRKGKMLTIAYPAGTEEAEREYDREDLALVDGTVLIA